MTPYHLHAESLRYHLRHRPDHMSRVDAVAAWLERFAAECGPKPPKVVHCRKGRDRDVYQTECTCGKTIMGPGDVLTCACGRRLQVEWRRPGLRVDDGRVVEQRW